MRFKRIQCAFLARYEIEMDETPPEGKGTAFLEKWKHRLFTKQKSWAGSTTPQYELYSTNANQPHYFYIAQGSTTLFVQCQTEASRLHMEAALQVAPWWGKKWNFAYQLWITRSMIYICAFFVFASQASYGIYGHDTIPNRSSLEHFKLLSLMVNSLVSRRGHEQHILRNLPGCCMDRTE